MGLLHREQRFFVEQASNHGASYTLIPKGLTFPSHFTTSDIWKLTQKEPLLLFQRYLRMGIPTKLVRRSLRSCIRLEIVAFDDEVDAPWSSLARVAVVGSIWKIVPRGRPSHQRSMHIRGCMQQQKLLQPTVHFVRNLIKSLHKSRLLGFCSCIDGSWLHDRGQF